jgi:hypothetical protein
MISIRQINEAVARKDFAEANRLADLYTKDHRIPSSIRLCIDIAHWRKHNAQEHGETRNQSKILSRKSNLHVVAGPFSTEKDLIYGLERLSFYIAPFASRITLLSKKSLPNELKPNSNIDPSVTSTYREYKQAHVFHRTAKPLSKVLSEEINTEHLVILDFSDKRIFLSELKRYPSYKNVKAYSVAASSRNEGSLFIQSVYDYLCESNTINLRTRKFQSFRFRKFIDQNKADEVSLVCNGPSIADISQVNPLSTKTKAILCNTAFLNEELDHHFDPICIVFADPIFHFGISLYSAEFRNNVLSKIGFDNYTPNIIIPEKYAHMLYHYMPFIEPFSIAIPHEKFNNFNLNLLSCFTSKTTANILTFLMMPIGATLAKNIYLFGVDGRPRNEDSYFWSHDKKSQLSDDKMANIRSVHPSFFSIEYNKYYDEHIDTCRSFCSQLETAGYELYCCTNTYIDPFRMRMHPKLLYSKPSIKAKTVFISINPDAGKNKGHYLNHERAIKPIASEKENHHIVLCHRDASLIGENSLHLMPTFSCKGSWLYKVDRLKKDFQNELLFSIADIYNRLDKSSQIIIYMYMGSTKVASWVSELLSTMSSQLTKRLQVYINCFYNIVDPNPEEIIYDVKLIEKTPYKSRIHLSIDTESARQELIDRAHLEIDFGVWPMIATTDYSYIFCEAHSGANHLLGSNNASINRKYAVYFPATSQKAKGVDLSLDLCLRLSYENPDKHYAIRKSDHSIDAGTASAFQEAETRGNIDVIISGDSDFEYLDTFLNSQVSCITYDPEFFRAKTSAVLLDSVASGCKIVCCKDTWLAQELCYSQLKAYALSDDHSAASYYAAVQKVQSLCRDHNEVAAQFLGKYSPTAMYDYLITPITPESGISS